MPLGVPDQMLTPPSTGSSGSRSLGVLTPPNVSGGGWIGALRDSISQLPNAARSVTYSNPMSQWLQSQAAASNGYYSQLQAGLGAQLNSLGAYTGNQASALRTNAGYASQLLGEQRFQDVDLGRQTNDLNYRAGVSNANINNQAAVQALNQAQDLLNQQNNNFANQQTGITRSWNEEQRYIEQLRQQAINQFNLQDSVADQANTAANRDYNEQLRQADEASRRSAAQLGLSLQELTMLRNMSKDQRNATLADIKKQRGFNDRDFAELKGSLANEANLSQQRFDELNRDLASKRGTADEDIAISRWLNEQQSGQNVSARDLALRQAAFTQSEQNRLAKSDAIARGAAGSRGYGQDLQSFDTQRGFADEATQLQFQQTADALAARGRGDENQYQAALNQLQNQAETGRIDYAGALEAQRHALAQGQLGYDTNVAGLNAQQRDALSQFKYDMQGYALRGQAAREQNRSGQFDANSMRRAAESGLEDALNQITNQRQSDWLGYQAQSSALQNRFNTGEIDVFNQRNAVNNNALMAQLQFNASRSDSQLAQRRAQLDQSTVRGQHDIGQQRIDSLARAYAARSGAAQAGLSQDLNSLYYQQGNQIANLNQQRASLGAQQQNALMQLLSQLGGY